MIKTALLDTNVIINHRLADSSDDVHVRLVTSLLEHDVIPLVSSSSLPAYFYLIQRDVKRRAREASDGVLTEDDAAAARVYAWACVKATLDFAQVVNVGHPQARHAYDLREIHDDYEDDLILAAAEYAGADCVITNDEQLKKHAPITCLSPEAALKLLGQQG